MFRDPDLEVDTAAIARHVRFLRSHGVAAGNAVLLAGGAAGDFSTMTFDERVQVAEAVRDAAEGAGAAGDGRADHQHARTGAPRARG